MRSDNVISLHDSLRARINCELMRARQKLGNGNIALLSIATRWGDTMDDRQVLDALRKLNQRGSIFDDITDTVD